MSDKPESKFNSLTSILSGDNNGILHNNETGTFDDNIKILNNKNFVLSLLEPPYAETGNPRGYIDLLQIGAGASPPAPVGYNYAALFAAHGQPTGWVAHGGAGRSVFFQDNAGTTQCTATGDPNGKTTDLSGNANALLQPTSTMRPVFHTAGGIRWWESCQVAGQFRIQFPAIDVYAGDVLTEIAVVRFPGLNLNTNPGGYLDAGIISNYAMAWPGGYHDFRTDGNTGTIQIISSPDDTSAAESSIITDPLLGPQAPVIVIATKNATGLPYPAPNLFIEVYRLNGTLLSSASHSIFTTGMHAGPLFIGQNVYGNTNVMMAFNMHMSALITPTEKTAILADLVSAFGTWNP